MRNTLNFLIFSALLSILLFPLNSYSVGKTAVLTLAFPYGAENTGLGECGVSYANSINSIFWNPANAPFVGQEINCQFVYSFFHEQLLPIFNIWDLYHLSNCFGFFLNDMMPYLDAGYVFNNNYLNFGETEVYDTLGNFIGTTNSYETVFSHTIGISLLKIIGLGINIKHFKSKMTEQFIARGLVFDVGVRLQKEFNLFDILKILPAGGLAFHSYGQEYVKYSDTSDEDPLPRMLWYGYSIKANVLDLFAYSYIREEEKSVVENEYTNHEGQKFQISPYFSINKGYMLDTAGSREEAVKGFTIQFNYQNTIQVINNIIKNLNKINKEGKIRELRYNKRFNIHASYSRSKIHSIDSPAREGQTRNDFSLGINVFPKKDGFTLKHLINNIRNRKRSKSVISEEDDELIE